MDRELSTYPGLMDFCQQLYDDRYRSPYLIACMIDAHEEMLENNNCDKESTLKKAVQVWLSRPVHPYDFSIVSMNFECKLHSTNCEYLHNTRVINDIKFKISRLIFIKHD